MRRSASAFIAASAPISRGWRINPVAIEEWLKRIPDFKLDPAGKVTWSEGTVRGPRQLPVLFGKSNESHRVPDATQRPDPTEPWVPALRSGVCCTASGTRVLAT